MAALTRLHTFVDINEADDDGADGARMSLLARHEAILTDGRRVVLLDDRGWSETQFVLCDEPPHRDGRRREVPGIWAYETVEELRRTARDVVGPDEPFDGRTVDDMEASHWETLARLLRMQGVDIDAVDLKALPHDVELSARVCARIGRGRGDARG